LDRMAISTARRQQPGCDMISVWTNGSRPMAT
jgi:hypothetical protein